MSAGDTKRLPGEAQRELLAALRERTAEGMTAHDSQRELGLAGVQDARRRLLELEDKGLAWRARRQGDQHRWFSTRELAKAWQALPAMSRRMAPMTGALGAFPMPVPVQVFARPQAAPADAPCVPGMALSRSEMHHGRVSARPAGVPFGGGFAAAGIGRDAITGTAWA